MGLSSYYRRFIQGFSKISHPITSLHKKGKNFRLKTQCQHSFHRLNNLLTTTHILKISYIKIFTICMIFCLDWTRMKCANLLSLTITTMIKSFYFLVLGMLVMKSIMIVSHFNLGMGKR